LGLGRRERRGPGNLNRPIKRGEGGKEKPGKKVGSEEDRRKKGGRGTKCLGFLLIEHGKKGKGGKE